MDDYDELIARIQHDSLAICRDEVRFCWLMRHLVRKLLFSSVEPYCGFQWRRIGSRIAEFYNLRGRSA